MVSKKTEFTTFILTQMINDHCWDLLHEVSPRFDCIQQVCKICFQHREVFLIHRLYGSSYGMYGFQQKLAIYKENVWFG